MKQNLLKLAAAALLLAGGWYAGSQAGAKAAFADGQLAACGEMVRSAPAPLGVKCSNNNGKILITVGLTGQKYNLDGSEAN